METDATVRAVLVHIQDGIMQHPATKPIEAYPELIHTWGTLLSNARQLPKPADARAEAGRRLLPLAGLCIRGVQELQLPLTAPKKPT